MNRSNDRILTTHVGSLPAPFVLDATSSSYAERLADAVTAVVEQQVKVGIDVVSDGELGKGHWISYVSRRIRGLEPSSSPDEPPVIPDGKDREEFASFYGEAMRMGTLWYSSGSESKTKPSEVPRLVCTGPLSYSGAARVDIANLLAAATKTNVTQTFLPVVAPASVAPYLANRYYPNRRDFLYALADALREEYETIAASGIVLQIDDAWTAALWDRVGLQVGLSEYQRQCMEMSEVLNHALRRIPEEKIRYHICWGSWHGPHAFDLPIDSLLDVILSVKAGAYLFEAANVRHEHEYHVWDHIKPPPGKILIPGVVSHATNVVEHPRLVAERILRFAHRVGRENVIAGTDCGLGGRVHPQIAWAKLASLVEGARLASQELW